MMVCMSMCWVGRSFFLVVQYHYGSGVVVFFGIHACPMDGHYGINVVGRVGETIACPIWGVRISN